MAARSAKFSGGYSGTAVLTFDFEYMRKYEGVVSKTFN
jgi:hypothetical protein